MDSQQASQMIPRNLEYTDIPSAILANPLISNKIGNKLTLNPPQKADTPYLFFTVLWPYQYTTDERAGIFYWHSTDWRLVAPSSWTEKEMRDFMDIVHFEVQKFERTVHPGTHIGISTEVEIFRIEKKWTGIFFDDRNNKGYKSLIYTLEIYYS